MLTAPIKSQPSPNQMTSKSLALKPADFIKMMITQLQNQDPLEPAKNQELLAQMSQIGQLQSSTDLQESLKGLVLQSNIGSAGNLIGKTVQGQDDRGAPISGLVTSIRIENNNVSLELDNGSTLQMSKVTSIGPPAAAATSVTTPGTAPAAAPTKASVAGK